MGRVRQLIRRTRPDERGAPVGSQDVRRRLDESMSLRADLDLVTYFPMPGREGDRHAAMGQAMRAAYGQVRDATQPNHVDRLLLAIGRHDAHDEQLIDGVVALVRLGLRVSALSRTAGETAAAGQLEDIDGVPVLGIRPFGTTHTSRVADYDPDVVFAVLALPTDSLVLLAVAVPARRSGPGPVLYRLRRAGPHGEPFDMLKFRSMVDGATGVEETGNTENTTDGLFEVLDDPMTPVSRRLRRTSPGEVRGNP